MLPGPILPKQPLRRRAEYVREQILKAIEEGLFPPGSRLPGERELAELLGVSRTSLREALSALQVAGVVEVRHGIGVFVKEPHGRAIQLLPEGTWDFLNLTQARYVVERGLVLLGLEEPQAPGLEMMERSLCRMRNAVGREDVEGFLRANVLFHQGLAKSGKNLLLTEISLQLLSRLGEADFSPVRRMFYLADPKRMAKALDAHEGIYLGIQRRDRSLALNSLYRHYADVVGSKVAEVEFLREEACLGL